jgi:YHS domain-containing protein
MNKLILSLLLAAIAGCSRTDTPQPTDDRSTQVLPAGMSRVSDTSQVCMVNDQFMGRPQIPVIVDGLTYYGCCPACKETLEKRSTARTALDPVTQEPVDKAKAVIVKDATGKVLYFASEETLRRFHG